MNDPLDEQVRRLQEKVHKRVEQYLKRVRSFSLAIPVLGPGQGGGLLYEKRQQIRDALRQERHFAYFPEEESSALDPLPNDFALDTVEDAFFNASDLIVLLLTPGGAASELGQLAENKKLASNTLVFIDKKARSAYVHQGLLKRMGRSFAEIHRYDNPEDLERCTLVKVTLDEARKRQETKARAIMNAESWGV